MVKRGGLLAGGCLASRAQLQVSDPYGGREVGRVLVGAPRHNKASTSTIQVLICLDLIIPTFQIYSIPRADEHSESTKWKLVRRDLLGRHFFLHVVAYNMNLQSVHAPQYG